MRSSLDSIANQAIGVGGQFSGVTFSGFIDKSSSQSNAGAGGPGGVVEFHVFVLPLRGANHSRYAIDALTTRPNPRPALCRPTTHR